jgi:hypothetical protein
MDASGHNERSRALGFRKLRKLFGLWKQWSAKGDSDHIRLQLPENLSNIGIRLCLLIHDRDLVPCSNQTCRENRQVQRGRQCDGRLYLRALVVVTHAGIEEQYLHDLFRIAQGHLRWEQSAKKTQKIGETIPRPTKTEYPF